MTTSLDIAVTAWTLGAEGLANEFGIQGEIAEQLGFHSFWLPENHFAERAIPSPLMLLAAVAARTRTLKLGSTSYLLPIRHPLLAAEEVAVLDRLSGGRVILGVGRGVQPQMFQAFDVDPKDKRKTFKANLDVMRRAWLGEAINPDGSGEAIMLAPRPVQEPHPPIWIAAFGPLAIKQAGSLGLPYLASPVETLEKLIDNYALHAEVAAASGHSDIDIVPVMRTVFITESERETKNIKAALDTSGPHQMREPGVSIDQWTIVGDVGYVRDKVNEYRERLGMTHLIVRGRIPGVDHDRQVRCLEAIAKLNLQS